MSYEIFYDRQPEKFLEKLDRHISSRIQAKIEAVLTHDPVPHNATTIAGEHGVFRIRIGDYRTLYRINHETRKIIIVKIDKRPRAYD